ESCRRASAATEQRLPRKSRERVRDKPVHNFLWPAEGVGERLSHQCRISSRLASCPGAGEPRRCPSSEIIKRFEFELTLSLKLKAITVRIQSGEIRGIEAGTCEGSPELG